MNDECPEEIKVTAEEEAEILKRIEDNRKSSYGREMDEDIDEGVFSAVFLAESVRDDLQYETTYMAIYGLLRYIERLLGRKIKAQP